MKSQIIATLALTIACSLAGAACKSSSTHDKASQTAQQESDPGNRNTEPSKDATGDEANAPGVSEPDSTETQPEVAQAGEESNETPAWKDTPPSAPVTSSKGATRVQMKNVDFHTMDPIVLRIRDLQGALLRRNRNTPPVFDDKRSFILRIDSGSVGIRMDSLTYLMNNYVFAYAHAPLKNLNLSTDGDKVRMTGKLHKGLTVPFKIVGSISATPEGKIQLHPTSIKAAGLPVKGLMKLFGLELDELLKTSAARGVSINDNDIILDPELMLPPPAIRGTVTAVRIEGDELIQEFGKSGVRRAVSPGQKGSNYMSFRGGTLRFGKLTMNNADLMLIDANPKDTFDFSLDHYNSQLVAGHTKNKSNFGLVVVMPDYNKLSQRTARDTSNKSSGTVLSRR